MVLGGKGRLQHEVLLDGTQLGHVSQFKYLGCALDELGKESAKCYRKMVGGKKAAGIVNSPVNDKSLHLFECERVLYEALLMPVLLHGNKTMVRRE